MSEYNLVDVISSHIKTNNTRLYTSLPALVDSFDENDNTVNVTLLVSDSIRGKNVIQSGKLLKVPVLFPSGGSFQQGFKLSQGDNVLINFCMRSLDNYHLTDGKKITVMENKRYHNISDAFATVGAFPKDSPVVSEAFKGYSYLLDDNTSIVFNKGSEGLTVTSDKDITVESSGTVNVKGAETVINDGTGYGVEFSELNQVYSQMIIDLNIELAKIGAVISGVIPVESSIASSKVDSVRVGSEYIPPPPPST